MALRSEWVGGVCNFMLVKKTSISSCLFVKKQTALLVFVCVPLVHMCVCLCV